MRRFGLFIAFMLIVFFCVNGQEIINKKFIKNKYGGPAVGAKKAMFVEQTIKEANGTLRYEIRDIKNNELVKSESYKDGLQVGKWITVNGTELNYDFELKYDSVEYTNVIHYDLVNDKVLSEISEEFVSPVLSENKGSFIDFFAHELRYPVPAQDNKIQGKVISQFIIDESVTLLNCPF